MIDPARPPRCSTVITRPYDVDVRLAQLGIARGWIATAVDRANSDHAFAPPFGLYGNAEYRAADRGLSELSADPGTEGWHRADIQRVPVVMKGDGTVAINVTTGDENTGLLNEDDPATTTLKGPATQRITEPRLNYSEDGDAVEGAALYTLLCRWGLEPRCELSRPRIMDESGHIHGWHERIIIGNLPGYNPGARRRIVDPATPDAQALRPLATRKRAA